MPWQLIGNIRGPKGRQGDRGEKGLDGIGMKGERGEVGPGGAAGVGLTDALLNRDGHLVLTLSDGRTKDIGPVVGRDADPLAIKRFIEEEVGKIPPPKDGKDGADGMTLEDVELVCDEQAGWMFRVSAGGRTKDYPLPLPRDVGPWTAGTPYTAGAGVSWDGGYWMAKRQTSDQPGTGDSWRLLVRRGKQGKEGLKGKDGKDGQDVRPSNTPPIYG